MYTDAIKNSPAPFKNQVFKTIKSECLRADVLWEDESFPADSTSIYKTEKFKIELDLTEVHWKRPHDICLKSNTPKFISDGATRFDINQQRVGDCYFLAALSSLTSNKSLLYKVLSVDRDESHQLFTHNYAGIFHFQFWKYGRWFDVVIDDRLPVDKNGRLCFLTSTDKDEFWSALLEKAYAKFVGCYEDIDGGFLTNAMEELSGGLARRINIRTNMAGLADIMLKAYRRGSLMGCSTSEQDGTSMYNRKVGIQLNHAYSVTKVKKVYMFKEGYFKPVILVQIRNPWGGEHEVRGGWRDGSPNWSQILEESVKESGLEICDDGEAWLEFREFCENFGSLQLCLLDRLLRDNKAENWNVLFVHGVWEEHYIQIDNDPFFSWPADLQNAALQVMQEKLFSDTSSFANLFWSSPKYTLQLNGAESKLDSMSTVTVGLMREGASRNKSDDTYIQFMLCGIRVTNSSADVGQFIYPLKMPEKTDGRELCCQYELPDGCYIIVPFMLTPGKRDNFLLRVYTDTTA